MYDTTFIHRVYDILTFSDEGLCTRYGTHTSTWYWSMLYVIYGLVRWSTRFLGFRSTTTELLRIVKRHLPDILSHLTDILVHRPDPFIRISSVAHKSQAPTILPRLFRQSVMYRIHIQKFEYNFRPLQKQLYV